jgi:hypothetical protein
VEATKSKHGSENRPNCNEVLENGKPLVKQTNMVWISQSYKLNGVYDTPTWFLCQFVCLSFATKLWKLGFEVTLSGNQNNKITKFDNTVSTVMWRPYGDCHDQGDAKWIDLGGRYGVITICPAGGQPPAGLLATWGLATCRA